MVTFGRVVTTKLLISFLVVFQRNFDSLVGFSASDFLWERGIFRRVMDVWLWFFFVEL